MMDNNLFQTLLNRVQGRMNSGAGDSPAPSLPIGQPSGNTGFVPPWMQGGGTMKPQYNPQASMPTGGFNPGSDVATPTVPNHVPPPVDRAATAQKMISAYQNNWNPNPIMARLGDLGGGTKPDLSTTGNTGFVPPWMQNAPSSGNTGVVPPQQGGSPDPMKPAVPQAPKQPMGQPSPLGPTGGFMDGPRSPMNNPITKTPFTGQ
jgi:hypothetical protein